MITQALSVAYLDERGMKCGSSNLVGVGDVTRERTQQRGTPPRSPMAHIAGLPASRRDPTAPTLQFTQRTQPWFILFIFPKASAASVQYMR